MELGQAAHVADAPVAEPRQPLHGGAHRAFAVDVEPRAIRGVPGPAKQDEGHVPAPQQRDTHIPRLGARQDEAVDLPLVEKARHRRDLVGLVLGGGDGQGPAFLARATADPVEKIGEERLVRVGAPGIEHQSQRPRAARANGLRLRHWPVTHPLRRPAHAQARRLGDIRVIV